MINDGQINVVLPHFGPIDPRVREALEGEEDLMVVECVGEDAYHELLRRCWRTGMDFLVVEHDIVVTDEAIQDLVDCPEPWCAQPYMVAGEVQVALGCTRFRGEFTQHWEGFWEYVADEIGTHWAILDAALRTTLGNLGVEVHQHSIQVEHLNPRASKVMSEETRVKVDAQLRDMRTARLLDRKARQEDADPLNPGSAKQGEPREDRRPD